ncbi:ATP-binding protein [Patescibacteria group bacterium]
MTEQTKKLKSAHSLFSETVRIFIILYIVTILAVGGVVSLIYFLEVSNEQQSVSDIESRRVELMKKYIKDSFSVIAADLEVLRAHEIFDDYLLDNDTERISLLAEELLAMANNKPEYDQIRVLNAIGYEEVRVNQINGAVEIIPTNQLQDKSGRYYFQDTLNLDEGQIYVSPFDLNVEQGEVEQPLKPMIRFGMPLVDKDDKKQGILLINYLGKYILDDLEDFYLDDEGQLMLLNSQGYWLAGPDSETEWGFMFPGKQDKTLAQQEPQVWADISSQERGQVSTTEGEYIFTTVYPISNSPDYFWKIISFVPRAALQASIAGLLKNLLLVGGILLLVMIIIIWLIAKSIARRRRAERTVIQLNDLLKVINKILRHDILNKLTQVKWSVEMYEKEKKQAWLKRILESSGSGVKLIERMKKLEKIASVSPDLQTVDIGKLLSEIIPEYKIPIKVSGSAQVLADEALLSVFENLINNAIRHGETKKIAITISPISRGYQIEVADFGKGIPDKIKKNLFQEGYIYGSKGHTGLGLYIVKKTIERYGGNISIKDNKPSGAIFVIQLLKG